MARKLKLPLGLLLAQAVRQAACSFSLDVSGPDWDFTTQDLANTTSTRCAAAYSAAIDCDETLLGIVASMRPAFRPTAADLDRTCVPSCSRSLDAYVAGVKAACDQPGDRALISIPHTNDAEPGPPVALIGEIFQYNLLWACSKNDTGYCYLTYADGPDWAKTDFPCSDGCAIQFYTNAHDSPGALYTFLYYFLTNETDDEGGRYAEGWRTVERCEGKAVDDGVDGASGTTTAGLSVPTTSTMSGTAQVGSVTGSGTATTPTPTKSSGSLSRMLPSVGWIVAMGLML
ncbi:hypothetical protein VTK73DRAFT_7908 [Phialemonium thermophilum]|uniref:Uncharacterized protein n=1 Tax=Phialemonium thermophilum TaxID=223376 RepID=A0ABR3WCM4_9PEZI